MASKRTRCIKDVGGINKASQDLQSCGILWKANCNNCQGKLIKYGLSAAGEQRLQCKECKKTQLRIYKNRAYLKGMDESIIGHLKEGFGIRNISRSLKISTTTVMKRILFISRQIKPPVVIKGKEYEVDEMRTFIQKKSRLIWIAYAIQKDTREVISLSVGRRTKRTLNVIIETLRLSQAKRIFTDKLNIYKTLIDNKIHSTKNRGTNYIERNHLTVRTHLKRLNRRTICFSRSIAMLTASLRIYFWA